MKQYKNTVQTIQNTVNTSTHITKTPAQLLKHPHITKPTHKHNHTLQNQLKQPQYKIHTKWNSHKTIKYPQYKVNLMCMLLGWVLYGYERCDLYRSLVAFGVLKYKGFCTQLRWKRQEMLIKYLKRNASKNIQIDDQEED